MQAEDGAASQDFAASRAEFIFEDDEAEANQVPREIANDDPGSDESPWVDLQHFGEPDLYAILGLSRSPPPSDANIRAAFHRASATFHPDKHPQSQQEDARVQFERIQTAYDILTDSKKRVIYDLLGEEGIRKEYGPGGVMRHEAYGRSKEIGPKAMSPEQFRAWFIGEMKKRERVALEGLVDSRTSFTLGVNAISFFPSKDPSRDFEIRVPNLRPSSFFVRSSFKVPFNLSSSKTDDNSSTPSETPKSDEEPAQTRDDNGQEEEGLGGHFSIYGSLGGPMQYGKKEVEIQDLETGEIEPKTIMLPPSVVSRSLTLGTTVYLSVPSASRSENKGGIRIIRELRTLVRGSEIEINTQMLPTPSSRLTFSRAFAPLEGTRPIHLRAQAVANHMPQRMPPSVNITLSRQLGLRQTLYCSWNSGTLFWPTTVQTLLAPIFSLTKDEDERVLINMESSVFSFGLNGFSAPSQVSPESLTRKQPSGESWGVEVGSSPHGSQLSVTYGRNVFRGQVPTTKLSEWTSESKEEPLPEEALIDSVNAVRLEIQASMALNGSLAWSVRGNRRFGDFTRAGISVGVQGARGLVLSLTWSRLGQSLTLPVAVCPFNLIDADVVAAMLAIPWLSYAIVHYGILKPGAARRRKAAIKRRREELEKSVVRKREESLKAIDLMSTIVQHRQEKEERNRGLVILEAQYGRASPAKPSRKHTEKSALADVTIPVAALVHHGQLFIAKTVKKDQLIGFYDPAPMKPKVLRVRYLFNGREHYVEFTEGEDVVCPSRDHQI